MKKTIALLASFLFLPPTLLAAQSGSCVTAPESGLAELSGIVAAAVLESSPPTFELASASDVALLRPGAVPEDLRLPAGNFERVPTHPAMGAELASLVKGREIGESRLPDSFFVGVHWKVRHFDSDGDGIADLFVVMDHFQSPERIGAVHVGAPPGGAGPRTVYASAYGRDATVAQVRVLGGGVEKTYRANYYQEVARDGLAITLMDFERDGYDGRTDAIEVGRIPHSNAPSGWPYVSYRRIGE